MSFVDWLWQHLYDFGAIGSLARAMKREYIKWRDAKRHGYEVHPDGWDVPCLPWRNSFAWIRRHIELMNEPRLLPCFYVAWDAYHRSLGKKSRRPKNLKRRQHKWTR